MEKTKKYVTVKVTSDEGHTEFSLTPREAIDKINEIYSSGGKWLYLDGTVVEPSRVTEAMLVESNSILLNNIVVGGSCQGEGLAAIFDLHVARFIDENGDSTVEAMDEKSSFPITIEMVLPDPERLITEPRFRLWIDESKFTEVAHMRDLIFKGVLSKLEEFVQKEHNKFKELYNV